MSIAARSLISPFDLHLFNEGTHSHLFDKLGAHLAHDPEGTYFAVWAPNADAVSVIGDFNGWDKNANGLYPREQSGIWEGFIPTVRHRARPPSSGTSTTTGVTRDGWKTAAPRTTPARRGRSTRCTSARGCGCPRKATAGSATASSLRGWRIT